MSIKINLQFKDIAEPELQKKVPDVFITRLISAVRFKKEKGYTDIYPAIVDTGAPLSLIPYGIWSECSVIKIAEHKIKGINSKDECAIPVFIGKIKCQLLDKKSKTNEFEMLTYLALSDNIPLILGFKNLLDKFKICFEHSKKYAFIEEI